MVLGKVVGSAAESGRGPRRRGFPARRIIIAACWLLLASCAAGGKAAQKRMERAQTKVFKASYDMVFPAVVEVLGQDYALTKVEREKGAIETAPKQDVVLNIGEFHGVYSLKARASVTSMEEDRTKVRLRVLAGRLLDFVENRWEYKDFGNSQYYKEYFRVIGTALERQRAFTEETVQK